MNLFSTCREFAGAGVRLPGACREFAGPVLQLGGSGGGLPGAVLEAGGTIDYPAGNERVEAQQGNQQQGEDGDGDLLGAGAGLTEGGGTALCHRWFLSTALPGSGFAAGPRL